MTVFARTFVVIIAAAAAILACGLLTGEKFLTRQISDAIEKDMMVVADIADKYVTNEIELLKNKAAEAAQEISLSHKAGDREHALARIRAAYPLFTGLAVFDETGLRDSWGEPPVPPDLAGKSFMRAAFAGGQTLSTTMYSPDGTLVMYVSAPMEGGHVLAAALPGRYFSDLLSRFAVYRTGHLIIDDEDGNVIVNTRLEWVQNRVNFMDLARRDSRFTGAASMVARGMAGERGTARFLIDDVPRICAFRPVSSPHENWFIGVIAPLEESPLKEIPGGLAVIAVITLALSVVTAFFAAGALSRPYEETERLRATAVFASKAKSKFLATMSHEIRTPMNVILGIAENYLQRGKLAPDIQDGFEKIFNAGGLLLSIINDILDLSKIEAGKLELIPAKYDMVSLINDVSHMNLLRFDHKPIEFKLRIAENIPLHVFGDALRIKQILNNLLTNAFKYTDSGEVVLAVSAENTARTDGDMVTLVYSVSDTGYGMTAEQIAKLFDEYAHVPGQEANRTSTGIGLGMAITHNLVDLMHGELFVDSTPGRGSTFTCRLPQKRIGSDMLGDELAENLQKFHFVTPAQAKKVRIVRDPMPYGKVLVVDDMASNIDVARLLLAPYGLQIDSAESGFEAIDIIKSGKVYDIVFMDHMMPKMDGVEAVRIIRESGYAHPILALTADAILGQAKMFLSKGFDDFISKPIDIRRLNALLNKFVRDRQPREVVEAARRQAKRMHEPVEVTTPQPGIAPTLAKTFRRDAARAIAVLEDLAAKAAETTYTDEDRRLYTVTVHGMKSALANVGEVELSSVAAKLEKAGRARDDAAASAQTPAFLNALREVVEKITLREDAGDGGMPGDERAYWREKLLAIKMACTAYDKKAAKDALGALAEKSWPPPAKDLLDTLAELLLHSKFKEIARIVDKETSTD